MPTTEASQDLATSSIQYSEAEFEVLKHSAQILGVPLKVLLSTPRTLQSRSRVPELESRPDQLASSTIQHDSTLRELVPEIADSVNSHLRSERGTSHSSTSAPNSGWVEVWEPGNEQHCSSEWTNGTDVNHRLLGESLILPSDEYETLLRAGHQYNHPNGPLGLESNISTLSTCELGDLPMGLEFGYLPPNIGPNDTTVASGSRIAKAASDRGQGNPGELEQLGCPSTDDCSRDIWNKYHNHRSLDRPLASDSSSYSNEGSHTSITPDTRPQSDSGQWKVTSSVDAMPAADNLAPQPQHQGEHEVDLDVERFPLVRSNRNLRVMRPPVARKSRPRGPYDRNVMSSGQSQQPRRRGPFKDDQQRLETGLTRRTKACIRCRMQRIRCYPDINDLSGTCLTCSSVSGPTLSKLPCLRYKIADTQLIDKGLHPRFYWTRRWTSMRIVEIVDWRSPEIKIITLTQDVGDISYDLQVREFVVREGDALQRSWKSGGVQHHYECAPYAIADMHKTGQAMMRLVDNSISTFLEYYVDEDNKLLRSTYSMAYRYMEIAERKEERELLRYVFRLWVASRMESRQERICSQETLGQELQLWDKEAGNYGNICVPPVLQAQIEVITTAVVLLPMKKAVLKGLQELIHANEPKSWFTMYLVMFILMHSCALLTKAEHVRARREAPLGSEQRYHNPVLVDEFHLGAKIMLAHFHYCNKGSHPFTDDWARSGDTSLARLDNEQLEFLRETVKQKNNRSAHFEYIKDNGVFEDEFYFVAQLYESNWKPRHTV